MSDVTFVVPSNEPKMSNEFNGTLLLATILKQKGVDVDIYRFFEASKDNGFTSFIKESAANILSKKPSIVSFYCRCDCYLADVMIAKEIKETSPEVYIVFGGPQADASSYNTLNEIPWVDFCCRGEGETTVHPLFSALLEGKDYKNVAGLSFRDSEKGIVENPVASLIEDLDELPFIDYSFVSEQSIENTLNSTELQRRETTIDVGRGCPFKCAYCSTSLFWQRKFRIKSTKRILDEMFELNKTFGFTNFSLEHDLFTASKKRVMEFTKALEESGKNFYWSCSSRIDTLDEEMVASMAKTGLKHIFLGVESGSERMQKLMNKNLRISDVIEKTTLLVNHNINAIVSFIYGLPEESEDDLEKTLQLAYKLYKIGVPVIQFHLCSITPGTQYYYQYKDNLTLSPIQSNINGDFGIEDCKEYIENHKNIFSYYYEYKSELRNKFSNLGVYIKPTFFIFDKLHKWLPDELDNKKLTEFIWEIMSMYDNQNPKRNYYDIALDYIEKYYSGMTKEKLKGIFLYYKATADAQHDSNFTASVEKYSIDIRAVNNNLTLDDIPMTDTLVYFNKINDELSIRTINMKK